MNDCELGLTENGLEHPLLQTLLAASVPVDQIILQAEALGYPPAEVLRIAEFLLSNNPHWDKTVSSVCLTLGAAQNWKAYVPLARQMGVPLLIPLVWDPLPLFETIAFEEWLPFSRKVLLRLGYPLCLIDQPQVCANPVEIMPWLESGSGLVADRLEFRHFVSPTKIWENVLTDALVLRDGQGPETISHAPSIYLSNPERFTRLFRVNRLQRLEGLRDVSSLVAVDCPDLEYLDEAPPSLVLKNCPSIRDIPCGSAHGLLLHLENCLRLQSIGWGEKWDMETGDSYYPEFGTVIVAHCPHLRNLPVRMKTEGHLYLRGMDSFAQWPTEFKIGGDLRIQDCPTIEELPAMEVTGTVCIEGKSGLRRMAPGTVIGKHLDLRACHDLEAAPRGIWVNGCTLLPDHLRQCAKWENPKPLLDMPVDRYPDLRAVLVSEQFPELAREDERSGLRDRAKAVLAGLRRELQENPALENELLWTASDVWRDLSEERWGRDQPWCYSNDSDDLFPMVWFREIILNNQILE